MVIKYVGRKTDAVGKTFWEIVANLRNFGVGRIVIDSRYKNYPETSFLKIVKVQPLGTRVDKWEHRRLERPVMIWAEEVFRGKKYPDLLYLEKETYKSGYQLVPKSEEHKYLNYTPVIKNVVIPRTIDWPPVMKILLAKDAKKKGTKMPELKRVINIARNSDYRLAEENEEPTVHYSSSPNINIGTDVNVSDFLHKIEARKKEIHIPET